MGLTMPRRAVAPGDLKRAGDRELGPGDRSANGRCRAIRWPALLGFIALVLLTGQSPARAPRAAAAADPPNFLLILVDDQATNSFRHRYMPSTFDDVVDHGTKFTNGLAAC